jgi:hypothetical protein
MDADAKTTRELPPKGSIVVFEEDAEGRRGHEIAVADATYRIITLGDVLLALTPDRR